LGDWWGANQLYYSSIEKLDLSSFYPRPFFFFSRPFSLPWSISKSKEMSERSKTRSNGASLAPRINLISRLANLTLSLVPHPVPLHCILVHLCAVLIPSAIPQVLFSISDSTFAMCSSPSTIHGWVIYFLKFCFV
jgi:hypothetical protein